MSTLEEYFTFAKFHPELFVNPSSGGFTIIMDEHEIKKIEAYMAEKLSEKGAPTVWARVGIVYQDQYGYILRDAVHFPDGTPGTYIRFIRRKTACPSVAILPMYQGGVLLVRRFHHATRSWHLEIPFGLGVEGMTIEESARKVLQENLQASITDLISLDHLDESPGMKANGATLCWANVASYGDSNGQGTITEALEVSKREFEAMVADAQITDGLTIVTYLRAKLQNLL